MDIIDIFGEDFDPVFDLLVPVKLDPLTVISLAYLNFSFK
jgi:hypothetical protein